MSTHSPACSCPVLERNINSHLDSGCSEHKSSTGDQVHAKEEPKGKLAPIFSQSQSSNLKSTSIPTISPEINSEAGPSKKKRKVDGSSSATSQPSNQKHTNRRVFGDSAAKLGAPLAERLRPQCLDDFVGQKHLIGPHSLLRNLLKSGNLGSIIFWGPPG